MFISKPHTIPTFDFQDFRTECLQGIDLLLKIMEKKTNKLRILKGLLSKLKKWLMTMYNAYPTSSIFSKY